METTFTEKNTKTFYYNYLKTNINVYIAWLQFLNSFEKISKKSYLIVAPKLDSVYNKTKIAATNYVGNHSLETSTEQANECVIDLLSDTLISSELSEIIPYMTSHLDITDITTITTAKYIRQEVLAQSQKVDMISEYLTDNPTSKAKMLISTMHELQKRLVTLSFNSEYLTIYKEFFANSLACSYKNNGSTEKYIYNSLQDIDTICWLISSISGCFTEEYESVHHEVATLLDDLRRNMYITNLESLVTVFSNFAYIMNKNTLVPENPRLLLANNK